MSLRAQASIVLACMTAYACAHSDGTSKVGQATTTGLTLPGQVGDPPGTGVDDFTPSSPELAEPDHPANRLATAACQRKQECDEIGDGKPHANWQGCLTSARRHAHEQLDRLSCEKGIDTMMLEACQRAVRISECAAIDNIIANEACSSGRLCGR